MAVKPWTAVPRGGRKFWKEVWRDRALYLLLVPATAFLLIYRYWPMYGITIAFKRYSIPLGIMKSPWVGLENFRDFLGSPFFEQILWNTVVISLYKLVICFPAPIILALMLNQVRHNGYKSAVQTVIYLPYFISWVVVGSIVLVFFAPQSGILPKVWTSLTGMPLDLIMNPKAFRGMLIFTEAWKETGWGTIVYLAGLTSISAELYEAAVIDGANKRQELVYITLPCLVPVIMTMLILRVGQILNAGFEQIFVLQNPMVYEVSEILDTYAYKTGFTQANYGLSTAVSLFKSVIGLLMVICANKFADRFGEGVI